MIDTHSHIDASEFTDDLDATIKRARQAGIEKIFVPSICNADMPRLLSVCSSYPGYLYPMIGLHPENIMDEDYHTVLQYMEQQLQKSFSDPTAPQFIAVGEVGLDLYWDDTHLTEQLEVFKTQIQWAKKYHLPLMIHCRKAHSQLISLMRKCGCEELTGVFHCFTGTEQEAHELLSFPGFCLGIGGVLTFKKSKLPEVVQSCIPLNRIVLETDSPYMAPVPHRGSRNESAYIVEVAKTLSQLFDISVSIIDQITTENALKIFRKV